MTAKIKLNAASGGGSFSLQAPSSSANNRVFTLPDSADATLLTSTTATGKILQVVSVTSTTVTSNTTATFADTGLTATISISASSKVLIIASQQLDVMRDGQPDARAVIKLLRGSTDIFAPGNNKSFGVEGANGNLVLQMLMTMSFLDTGASTGSNTYKTQFKVNSADNNAKIRISDDSSPSTMTLLEVAG